MLFIVGFQKGEFLQDLQCNKYVYIFCVIIVERFQDNKTQPCIWRPIFEAAYQASTQCRLPETTTFVRILMIQKIIMEYIWLCWILY